MWGEIESEFSPCWSWELESKSLRNIFGDLFISLGRLGVLACGDDGGKTPPLADRRINDGVALVKWATARALSRMGIADQFHAI
ncbi:uncharacterized protein N7477_007428 [Penicillium maclennaniae]|uniref:uncharacterized protein n=1 Tax=Penicillium maclennaniae TaxID=1343394 RepID=UPI002541112C|nr:uncharacterized protein N7477_007428 [Penicillium maclennaniae]KAJ5664980.1 hypothetical protein N7477_007428 [Penicillium maclennaniae]